MSRRNGERGSPNRTGPPFLVAELAFFCVPRTWKEVMGHFRPQRSASDILDAIIEADCDGGRGFIDWRGRIRAWVLTDEGREYVDQRAAKGEA